MVTASIGLVGQVFNLDGGWASFATWWALLSFPFVLFSSSVIFNMIWLRLFFSIFNCGLVEEVLEYSCKHVDGFIWISLYFLLLNYIGRIVGKMVCKHILLPKAFSKLALLATYITIFTGGLFWCILEADVCGFFCKFLANFVVFVFLGIHMFTAIKK